MPTLITDHKWRALDNARVSPGGCAWLGTCGRPASEHVHVKKRKAGRPPPDTSWIKGTEIRDR